MCLSIHIGILLLEGFNPQADVQSPKGSILGGKPCGKVLPLKDMPRDPNGIGKETFHVFEEKAPAIGEIWLQRHPSIDGRYGSAAQLDPVFGKGLVLEKDTHPLNGCTSAPAPQRIKNDNCGGRVAIINVIVLSAGHINWIVCIVRGGSNNVASTCIAFTEDMCGVPKEGQKPMLALAYGHKYHVLFKNVNGRCGSLRVLGCCQTAVEKGAIDVDSM